MADQEPPAVHQESTTSISPTAIPSAEASSDCPFCTIATNFPPTSPLADTSNTASAWKPEKLDPPTYVLLTTEDVIAFLDIAPLTRGHVLVAPRNHRVKVGDLKPMEMSEIEASTRYVEGMLMVLLTQIGRVLPVVVRAVLRAVLPDIPHAEVDYNIVQNNGPGAAQVIPHVHFHIVPRPPLNYREPSPNSRRTLLEEPSAESHSKRTRAFSHANHKPPLPKELEERKSKYPPNEFPTAAKRSYIQFGRGMRQELDDEDALVLIEDMRACLAQEWYQEFGSDMPDKSESKGELPTRIRSPEKL